MEQSGKSSEKIEDILEEGEGTLIVPTTNTKEEIKIDAEKQSPSKISVEVNKPISELGIKTYTYYSGESINCS